MGICAGTSEYFDRPALAAMVATIPGEAYRVFSSPGEGEGPVAAGDRAWIERAAPPFGIVHADPTNAQTPGLIDGLALATSGFLVGGLTSSRGAHAQVAGHITDGGISGVLFAPEVEVATGLSQGCTPLAESHIVSDCIDEVIIGLDGERALDLLKAGRGRAPGARPQSGGRLRPRRLPHRRVGHGGLRGAQPGRHRFRPRLARRRRPARGRGSDPVRAPRPEKRPPRPRAHAARPQGAGSRAPPGAASTSRASHGVPTCSARPEPRCR